MGYVVVAALVGFGAGVVSWWLVSRLQLVALQTQRGHAQQRAAQLETLVGELRRKLAALELQLRQAALVEPTPSISPTRLTSTSSPAGLEGSMAQTEPGEHSRLRQLEDELAQARQRVTLLQAQLTTVKGRLLRLEDDVVQARQRAAAAEAMNQEHVAEVRTVQERAETLQNQLEQAAERIYQLEHELEQARAQTHPEEPPGQPLPTQPETITGLEAELDQLKQALRDVRAQLAAAQSERDAAQAATGQARAELVQLQREREIDRQPASFDKDRVDRPAREAGRTLVSSSPGIKSPVGARSSRPRRLEAEELVIAAEAVAALDEATAGLPVKSKAIEEGPQPAGVTETAEAEELAKPAVDESEDVSPQSLREPEILSIPDQPEERVAPPEMKAYCTKCRAKRVMVDPEWVLLANERPAWKGSCPACGSSMFRFAKS